MARKPIPSLQRLRLDDLPIELIHTIFSFCSDKDITNLTLTSKKMWDIGRNFAFKVCANIVPFVNLLINILQTPVFGVKGAMAVRPDWSERRFQEYRRSCDLTLAQSAAYLKRNPNVLHPLQKLTVVDEWSPPYRMEMLRHPVEVPRFHKMLNPMLSSLMQYCINLTDLRLNGIAPQANFLEAVAKLPLLSFIELHASSITRKVAELLRAGSGPRAHKRLRIRMVESPNRSSDNDWESATSMWALLPFFTELENLVVEYRYATLWSPALEATQDTCNPMRSAERVWLSGVHVQVVQTVSRWMQTSSIASLPLTHLKLFAPQGIDGVDFLVLVDALQSAPNLRVFSLGALLIGTPEVINRLAVVSPNLTALTLLYGATGGNRHPPRAFWPRQTGEYAVALSAFTRLNFFGWNFRIPYVDYSPASMVCFEGNYVNESSLSSGKIATTTSSTMNSASFRRLPRIVPHSNFFSSSTDTNAQSNGSRMDASNSKGTGGRTKWTRSTLVGKTGTQL